MPAKSYKTSEEVDFVIVGSGAAGGVRHLHPPRHQPQRVAQIGGGVLVRRFRMGDVGREADAVRTVAAVIEKHGRLDILVNNAGYGIFKPLVDMELAELEGVFRTNVFGAFLMAREAARQFVKQGSGELINISSTSGLKGGRGSTAYSSSKFALRGMTECWRDELRRHDVRVMLVNPSEVLTEFASKAGGAQQASAKKLRPEEIADAIVGALKVDSRGFIPEFSVFATNPF